MHKAEKNEEKNIKHSDKLFPLDRKFHQKAGYSRERGVKGYHKNPLLIIWSQEKLSSFFFEHLKSNGEEKSILCWVLMMMMIFHFPSNDFLVFSKGKQTKAMKNLVPEFCCIAWSPNWFNV